MVTTAESGLKIGGAQQLRPLDEARAAGWLADLARAATDGEAPRLAHMAGAASSSDARRLAAVMDLSPYLGGIMLRRPEWLEPLFHADGRSRIAEIVAELNAAPAPDEGEKALMRRLREAKLEASLLLALRDLLGAADPDETVRGLSDLADAAIGAALRFALAEAERSGRLALSAPARPEAGSGLFVLGMGKLGAHELNYSSDIDLILFFDPEAGACRDPAEGVETFARVAKKLVKLLSERTADGYVFRTDLRLRPDPGAMPVAMPVDAALTYYEGHGRNWERAAMIKARVVAGDRPVGEAFLAELSPFVWRRYLDFAAIVDIQAMKNRIDRHRGFDGVAAYGQNVKLGPGGIREVEFFAQIQQLIAGGREPRLRGRRTVDALAALARAGWIEEGARAELTEAYWFLRRVEHAVQMVADEQTHDLPEAPAEMRRIARLLGFEGETSFVEALLERMRMVEARFSGLFAEDEAAESGDAVLARLLDGGETEAGQAALRDLGYKRVEDVARIVAGWGLGRHRATRSAAAREHLAGLLPSLLPAFAKARDPDAAIAAFDGFVAGLPSGLQFFSLLASNPRLLDLLARIITAAPLLADTIARRPHVFDALIDPAFFDEMPDRALMEARLTAFLADAGDYEEVLARLRSFASEQRFLVGARLLVGALPGEEAGRAFSLLADVVIDAALGAVVQAFEAAHGRVPGGRVSLLGMGRLGSRELTAGSDVDLMLIYDHDREAEESDGGRALPVSTYYARLTQRLIAALSAPMRDGILYEVDFRLRPSGNKGPLATHIDAFRKYQAEEAWTWERMALTRSRPLAGDAGLVDELVAAVRAAIEAHRDDAATGADVSAMRHRIEREKKPRGPLDLKLRPGGLIDLEFIAQWAILTGRVALDRIGVPTSEVLDAYEAANGATGLAEAMRLYTRLVQLVRLGPAGAAEFPDLSPSLAEQAMGCLDADTIEAATARLDAVSSAVRDRFDALLPAP